MPKIKSIVHRFAGKAITFEIWHNIKTKFYIKGGLPMHILEVLGDQIITELYDSPDQLDLAIRDFAKDYDAAILTSKKVIIYRINFGNDTLEGLDLIGTKYLGGVGIGVRGYGFNFDYHIGMQHTIDKKIIIKKFVPEFYDSDHLVESHHVYNIKQDETIIDWTFEREQFFRDLKESTNILCDKITKFFGKDDASRLKAIDSGVKLLSDGK